MIENQTDIDKYTNENKIYIPQNKLNQNYNYYINGDNITIITNESCYTNYNTTYCNCNIYNYKNNIMSDTYTCSTNNNNAKIPYTSLSNNINDSIYIRERFIQDKSLYLIMIIVGVIIAIFLTKERKSL